MTAPPQVIVEEEDAQDVYEQALPYSHSNVFAPAQDIAEEVITEVESGQETTQRDTMTARTKQYNSDYVTPRDPYAPKGDYVTPVEERKAAKFGYESSDLQPKYKNAYESSDYEPPKAPNAKRPNPYASSSDYEPPKRTNAYESSDCDPKRANAYVSSSD